MKKYYNFSILVVIIILGCASKKNIVGYYTNTDKIIEMYREELILFKDGRYLYKIAGSSHNSSSESSGTWINDSLHHVYLTSDRQFTRNFKVHENIDVNSDAITIKTIDANTQDILQYVEIVLFYNDKRIELITDYDGLAKFYGRDQIDSIQFFDVSYFVKNKESNNFKIEANRSEEPYVFLNNKELIKKNKKLLWPTGSGKYRVLKKR
ncbi:hypothetical protein [uncultured Dokdonia sp.]|uniref:hypothetical protein n=1 Tax=uncultured Dokdonia sp. TaxID=575653 RepID=UPI002605EAD5|nr:hypothetical protein [uncultured Dokdonia sp.]